MADKRSHPIDPHHPDDSGHPGPSTDAGQPDHSFHPPEPGHPGEPPHPGDPQHPSDPERHPGVPPGIAFRIVRAIGHSPATLLMLTVLVAVALLTGTNALRLPREVLESVGYPPRTFGFDQAYRVVTSAFVTIGPRVLPGALIMVALAMGAAELAYGSLRALLAFWGVHLFTFASTTVLGIVIGDAESLAAVSQVLSLPDVGPSAGYMGCLGAALARYRHRAVRVLAFAVVLWLIADLAGLVALGPRVPAETAADIAHLIALPAGWLLGWWWVRTERTVSA